MLHNLNEYESHIPFRKISGKVISAMFHPHKPLFYLALQHEIRIYDLLKKELFNKLSCGTVVTNLAIHPTGDHLLVGYEDERICWYDLKMSSLPYKVIRNHKSPVRSVAFHRSLPLFASAGDDSTCQLFYGKIFQDLVTSPLLISVKTLRGHDSLDCQSVSVCYFHPIQPWIFTAGADGKCHLYCD